MALRGKSSPRIHLVPDLRIGLKAGCLHLLRTGDRDHGQLLSALRRSEEVCSSRLKEKVNGKNDRSPLVAIQEVLDELGVEHAKDHSDVRDHQEDGDQGGVHLEVDLLGGALPDDPQTHQSHPA